LGGPRPSDPTRPITTFKTAWKNVRKNAKVTGRWRDNRYTLITDLAESGAGDQTIMDIAGHVSKRVLRHYSHIRMEAKRTALESIVKKQTNGGADQTEDSRSTDRAKGVGYPHRAHGYRNGRVVKSESKSDCSESIAIVQGFDVGYPQKSPRGAVRNRKSKKIYGS
jgi:hypothetical protein